MKLTRYSNKKIFVCTVACITLLLIYQWFSDDSIICQYGEGEGCDSGPPRDWKLKPYNGIGEHDPIRRRFVEEQEMAEQEMANDQLTDVRDHSVHFMRKVPAMEDLNKLSTDRGDLREMFDIADKYQYTPKIRTQIKTKEIYIPKPCHNNFNRRQKYVKDCITNEILGKVPDNLTTVPFQKNLAYNVRKKEDTSGRRASFKRVYDTNAWGKDWDPNYKDINGSGRGATLSWTQELIASLHIVINEIKQHLGLKRIRILDLPCGDMAWMSRFLLTRDDIDYTGIDIVPDLIEHHRHTFNKYPWKFRAVDVLEHPLQDSYDLILCRMLLQHLYLQDVVQLLHQFSFSNSSFLLATSFSGSKDNQELQIDPQDNPGRFRKLNLEIPPLSLTPPWCIHRDGPPNDFEGWNHFAGLWKLPLTQVKHCSQTYTMDVPGNDKVKLYSCTKWRPS